MCKAHPRYQAKRKSRVECLDCWQKYLQMNPDATLKAREINTIFVLLAIKLGQLDYYARSEIRSLDDRTTPIEFQY